jgi:hypothetical protein
MASEKGNTDSIEALIKSGADPNQNGAVKHGLLIVLNSCPVLVERTYATAPLGYIAQNRHEMH